MGAAVSAAAKSRTIARPEGRRSAPVPAHKDELMIDTFALPHRCPAANGGANHGPITAKSPAVTWFGFCVVNLSHRAFPTRHFGLKFRRFCPQTGGKERFSQGLVIND